MFHPISCEIILRGIRMSRGNSTESSLFFCSNKICRNFADFVVADPLDLSSGQKLGLLKLIIVEQARPLHCAPCNLKKVERIQGNPQRGRGKTEHGFVIVAFQCRLERYSTTFWRMSVFMISSNLLSKAIKSAICGK